MTEKMEAYLPDARVSRVADILHAENPILDRYNTDLVTARIEPPWHGRLPTGDIGWTQHPLVQFIAVSDHPRPIQKKMGARHATVTTVFQQAFEDSEKERKHLVSGAKLPPEEIIFRGVVHKHVEELESLQSIIN